MNEKSFDILSVLGKKASLEPFPQYIRIINEQYKKYNERKNQKERDD